MRYHKAIIIFVVLIFKNIHSLLAQGPEIINTDKYKSGVYLKFEDFLTNNPKDLGEFELVPYRFDRMEIHFVDSMPDNFNEKEIWGISTGNEIYVNARNYQIDKGFVKLLGIGRYCYFKDKVSINELTNNVVGIGGVFGMAIGNIRETTAILLNINNGKFYYATSNVLEAIFKQDNDLLESYKNAEKRHSTKTKFLYLEEYNALNESEIDGVVEKYIEVVFYRRDKKQIDKPMMLKHEGKLLIELGQNDVFKTKILNAPLIEFCADEYCTKLNLNTKSLNYVNCSWTAKNKSIEVVEKKVGDFYYNKLNYLKEKEKKEKENE